MIMRWICCVFIGVTQLFGVETLVLIGSPGSGKGTFAQVAKEHGYAHISAGDLIRDEIRQKTPLGLSIEETVKEGKYIDPDVMFTLLKNRIMYYVGLDMPLIVDGYGRTKEDANLLKQLLKELQADVHVLFLQAQSETCLERMLHRLVCQGCDFVSNESLGVVENQTCPKCGQNIMQKRINDERSVIEKRLVQYHNSVKPNYSEFLEQYPSDVLDTESDYESCLASYQQMIAAWKK